VALKDFQLNNEQYMKLAFDPKTRNKLVLAARLRRNVYTVLFFIGIICIFVAGLSGWAELSVLSLFLATLSLVVVTKYDTQLYFLEIIATKKEPED
jgi:uncharacterized membrane protein YjjP (DUF1212 family)